MGTNAIYSQAIRQRTVSHSSTDAEIKAAAAASRQVKAAQLILLEMNIKPELPTPLHIDNVATIYVGQNDKTNNVLRHVAIDIAQIREFVDHGVTTLVNIDTADNNADIHTKPLASNIFKRHRAHITYSVADKSRA